MSISTALPSLCNPFCIRGCFLHVYLSDFTFQQRLAGAPVLIVANKQDLPSALPPKEIREVRSPSFHFREQPLHYRSGFVVLPIRYAKVVSRRLQCWRCSRESLCIFDVHALACFLQVLSLETLCVNRHFAVFGCSARNGDDIADAMHWLIEDVANRVFVKV